MIIREKLRGKPVNEIEAEIAKAINKAPETVHGWRFGSGGPSDLETIKDLGALLCHDPDAFLISIPEESTMTKLTDRQLSAFKRVHDEIWLYLLEYFWDTDGFHSFIEEEQKTAFDKLSDSATDDEAILAVDKAEGRAAWRAERRWVHLLFVLEQESFDLHGTELYDELWHLIQTMNETWMVIKPVHHEITTDDGYFFDDIDNERFTRYQKALKALVEKYN